MKRKIFSACCFFVMFSFLLMMKPETVNIPNNEEVTTEVIDTSDAEVSVKENETFFVQDSIIGAGVANAIVQPPLENIPLVDTEVKTEEPETETETEPEVESNLHYCEWGDFYISEDDYKLLLTTTFCESGNQPLETQHMTALVILNRVVAGMGGDTVRDIVYAKNAFSVIHWSNFEDRGWTKQVEQAVELALKENPHPRNMYYFRTKHYHSWAEDYMKSGDVYFSTKK